MKIKDLITEDSWTKCRYFEFNDKRMEQFIIKAFNNTDEICRMADRCCLTGWVMRIYEKKDRVDVLKKLYKAFTTLLTVSEQRRYNHNIVDYNDWSSTTFKDIKQLVERADV